MQSYAACIYVSPDFQDRLDFCLPSLLRTQASAIHVYTDRDAKLVYPADPRIHLWPIFAKARNWSCATGYKTLGLLHCLQVANEPHVYHCDADCLVLCEPGEMFANQFDVTVTVRHSPGQDYRLDQLPIKIGPLWLPIGSIWIKGSRWGQSFVQDWVKLQNEMIAGHLGTEQVETGHDIACDMISFIKLVGLRRSKTHLLGLNTLLYNSHTLTPRIIDRRQWITWLHELQGRVWTLHYPQNAFRDRVFVRASTTAATGDPNWWDDYVKGAQWARSLQTAAVS